MIHLLNTDWELLITVKADSLPISVDSIKKHIPHKISSYEASNDFIKENDLEDYTKNDAFTFKSENNYIILYNGKLDAKSARVAILHELCHIKNGHMQMENASFDGRATIWNKVSIESDNEIEESADDFAAKVLAPACVLWALKVKDAKEIENLCLIPPLYARRRAERMAELYKRENKFLAQRGYSCFLTSALEKKVYENFTDYIGEMKKMRQNKFLVKIKRAIK